MKNSHNNFKKLDKNESVRLDYKPTGFGDFFFNARITPNLAFVSLFKLVLRSFGHNLIVLQVPPHSSRTTCPRFILRTGPRLDSDLLASSFCY